MRIDPNDRVEVEVPIVLKGTAPGMLAGGVLDFHLHSVTIECLAIQIPDNITVKIGELQMEQAIHVRELELPANTVVKNDPETVVVQVKHIVEVAEPTAEAGAEPGPTQPEIVGRKVKETTRKRRRREEREEVAACSVRTGEGQRAGCSIFAAARISWSVQFCRSGNAGPVTFAA